MDLLAEQSTLPTDTPLGSVIYLVVLGTFGLIGAGWCILKWRSGQEILEATPHRLAPWNGVAVLLFFVGQIALLSLAIGMSGIRLDNIDENNIDLVRRIRLAMGGANLVAMALMMAYLAGGLGVATSALGIPTSMAELRRGLKIGVIGYFVISLPVLLVQILTSMLVEYEHPVIDMLRTHATPEYWMAALFSAVLVAPICEEFSYRLVLQGWLERAIAGAVVPFRFLTIGDKANDQDKATQLARELNGQNLFESPELDEGARLPAPAERMPMVIPGRREAWLPVIMSATIFSLLHLGQGLAFIPLFVFGLGVGYIYRQTNSIFPTIIIHMMTNAASMMNMWFLLGNS